jgi:5-methylcytosine-specific restriction endonuclease McrA
MRRTEMARRRKFEPRTTRLTCPKCETSIDLEGNHSNASRPCPRLGCDGIATKYKQKSWAWTQPRTLSPDPVVTRPNKPTTDTTFIPPPVVYKTYEEYLASDLWKHIRGAVIRRDNRRCRICRKRGSQVHHLSYAKNVMEGRALDKLVLLCRRCHKRVEFTTSGRKRSVSEAADVYLRLAKEQSVEKRHKKRRRRRKRVVVSKAC